MHSRDDDERPAAHAATPILPSVNELKRTRLDSLTALRFPAALVVFLLHATSASKQSESIIIRRLFQQGAVGVSFFFILSGFVLAWATSQRDTPRAFYRRRFARVWPAHAITWLLAGAIVVVGSAEFTVVGALLSLLLMQAWVPEYSIYYAMNAPSWSLSVEAFFYCCFPFIIGRLRSMGTRGRWTITAVMAGVTISAALIFVNPESGSLGFWFIYIFPLLRVPEFVIGMCLALNLAAGWRPPLSLGSAAILATTAYIATGFLPTGIQYASATLIPFSLLIAAAAAHDLSGRQSFVTNMALVRLGVWSFCFYLVHVPILTAIEQIGALGPWTQIAAALPICVLAAAVLHEVFESPIERRLRSPRKLIRAT